MKDKDGKTDPFGKEGRYEMAIKRRVIEGPEVSSGAARPQRHGLEESLLVGSAQKRFWGIRAVRGARCYPNSRVRAVEHGHFERC